MSAPIERAVRTARRRLILQAFLNRLAVGWAVALLFALGWLLAEPWLFDAPPARLKWLVAGGFVAVATLAAVVLALRAAPTAFAAALELDARFGLKERVTTALGLRPHEVDTPAGTAVVADAAERVSPLAVRSKFPVHIPRQSLAVPTLVGALALAAVFYHPNTARTEAPDPAAAGPKPTAPVAAASPDPKKPVPPARPKPTDRTDRTDKSEKLKDLEAELDRMRDKHAADPDRDKPEKQREKVADLTALEDKLKKFTEEKIDKLARAEQQLRELNKLKRDPEFADGPAKELNDALAKGDLKKAQEAVDELGKKVREKKLDKEDEEKLARQLARMKDQTEQMARNKEREQKLKDLIDKAKKEGRDAESLERELGELKQEAKESGQALEELAQRLEKARAAAEKGDLEQLANELEAAGKELKNMEGDLKDIEDVGEYLQRLKGEKAAACKGCEGEGKCKGMGEKDSDEWNNGGTGAGRRPENKDAQTSSQDERLRGLFDPRGKKSYGGSTKGQAFNKRTTADLGTEIREAVQEAPQAADGQRLPRDARDAVREYFQNLGGQAPK